MLLVKQRNLLRDALQTRVEAKEKRILRGLWWEGGELIPFFQGCVPKDSSSAKLEAQYWMGWEEAIRGKGDNYLCGLKLYTKAAGTPQVPRCTPPLLLERRSYKRKGARAPMITRTCGILFTPIGAQKYLDLFPVAGAYRHQRFRYLQIIFS
jgi:hypothetical protein